MTTEDFAQGMVFGAFMEEVRASLTSIDTRLGEIMAEIDDLQAQVEAQSMAIAQAGVDFNELTARVDALVAAVGTQVTTLTDANAVLQTQVDTLTTELGADNAAVAAAADAVSTNNAALGELSTAMDAFHESAPEPTPEPTP